MPMVESAGRVALVVALMVRLRICTAWQITHTGVNGMIWETSTTRILVDPLVVGSLTFLNLPQLYSAKARGPPPAAELLEETFDAVVLTQGLPDHAHLPTLRALRPTTVYGPPSAEGVARCSGKPFRCLDHGQVVSIGDVTLRALPGALVGPPWQKRENSILATTCDGRGVYYEPHGDYESDALLRQLQADVDVLIAPATTQRIAGVFDLVKGNDNLDRAAKLLDVDVVVDLPNGDVDADGLLAPLVAAIPRRDSAGQPFRLIRPALGARVSV
mmetsp:Transcript_16394/g.53374  ORF Transcript_16394/g.53374 Transcript_16394/m.53374 type:complete len:273 (+) Transcript_16394:261-1079(+)